MAINKQTVIGLSSNLITGSAALFYNKAGAIDQISAGTTWSSTKVFYPWQTTTPDNSWDTGVTSGSLSTATSAFSFSDGSTVTEYWEVPPFLAGAPPATGDSYAYTLEQAHVDASGTNSLKTFLAGLPEYSTLGKTHPYGTIGYTTNGLSITFTPEWGEIQVDQLLDAARIFKTGQTATLNTTVAEATLENLAIALAQPRSFYPQTDAGGNTYMELNAGNLYDCPVERSLVAVGPGQGGCEAGQSIERVYTGYRALSQEAVTINMSRNDPQTYDVAFRLMPNSAGSYGRVVDRVITATTQSTPAFPYS